MRLKKSLIIICIFICLISFTSAHATDINDTEIIANEDIDEAITTENHIDEVFTDENQNNDIENYTTLSKDIDKTNDNETLTLKNDYQYYLNNDQKTISISKSMTIDGNGHYIDGNNANGFFTINANNVTLKNIIFKNAKTNDSSLIWNYANGKLINCTFENINASNCAIYVSGNSNIISDCTFINCTSKGYAGAIYCYNINIFYRKGLFQLVFHCFPQFSKWINMAQVRFFVYSKLPVRTVFVRS